MADEIVGDLKVNINADAQDAVTAFGNLTKFIKEWADGVSDITGTLVRFTGVSNDAEDGLKKLAESINNNVNVQFERLSEVVSEASEKSIIALGRLGTAGKNTATQVADAMQEVATATEKSSNEIVKASEESIKAWQYRTKQITSDAYIEYLDAEIEKLEKLDEVTAEYMRTYEIMRRVQGETNVTPASKAKQLQAQFVDGDIVAREYVNGLTAILEDANQVVEKSSVEYGQIVAQRKRVTESLLKQEALEWKAFVALYTKDLEDKAKADALALRMEKANVATLATLEEEKARVIARTAEEAENTRRRNVGALAVLQEKMLADERAAIKQSNETWAEFVGQYKSYNDKLIKEQFEANAVKKAEYDADIGNLQEYVNQTKSAFDAISSNTQHSVDDYVRALRERTNATKLMAKQNKVEEDKAKKNSRQDNLANTGTEHWSVSGWTQIMSGMMVVQPLMQATEAAANFQEKLTKLSATAGESASALPQLGENILKVSTDFGIMADKVADTQYTISSLGQRGAAGLTLLTNAAKLARGSQVDMSDAGKLLVHTMINYNQTADEAARNTDIYTRAVTLSLVQGKEFIPALASLQLMAKNASLSTVETASALDIMTQHTKSAAVGATYLRNLLQGIVKPTSEMSKAFTAASKSMKEQGDTVDAYRLKMIAAGNGVKLMRDEHLSFGEVFGSILRATKSHIELLDVLFPELRKNQGAMALLNDGLKDYNKTLALNNNSQGANAAALKNQKQDAQDLASAWNALYITVGTALIPVMEALTKDFIKFTDAFSALPKWEREAITYGAAFAGGLMVVSGIVRVFVGSLLETVSWVEGLAGGLERLIGPAAGVGDAVEGTTVATTSALGPIALLVDAVIGLTAAWITNYGKIRDAMEPFFHDVEASFASAGKAIMGFCHSVLPELEDTLKKLEPIFEFVFHYIGDFLVRWFNEIKSTIALAWTVISGVLKIGLDIISMHWSLVWGDIKNTTANVLKSIENVIVAAIPGSRDAMDQLGAAVAGAWHKHMDGIMSSIQKNVVNPILYGNGQMAGILGDDGGIPPNIPDDDGYRGSGTGSTKGGTHSNKRTPTPPTADQIEAAKEAAEEAKLNALVGGGEPVDFRDGLAEKKKAKKAKEAPYAYDPTSFLAHIDNIRRGSRMVGKAHADPNAGATGMDNYDERMKARDNLLSAQNAGITTKNPLYGKKEENLNNINANQEKQLITDNAIQNVTTARDSKDSKYPPSTLSQLIAQESSLAAEKGKGTDHADKERIIREKLSELADKYKAQSEFLNKAEATRLDLVGKLKTLNQEALSIETEIADKAKTASDVEDASFARQVAHLQAKNDYQDKLLSSQDEYNTVLARNLDQAAQDTGSSSSGDYFNDLNKLNEQAKTLKDMRDTKINLEQNVNNAKDAFDGLSNSLGNMKQQYEAGSLSLKDYVANLELARTTALNASKYYSGISGADTLANKSAEMATTLGQQEVEAITKANDKALEASKKAGESLADGFTSAFMQAIKKSKSISQSISELLKNEAEKQLEITMKNSIETLYKRANPAKQIKVPNGIAAPEIKFSSAVDTFWMAVQAFTGRSGAVSGGTGTQTGLGLAGTTALNVAGQFGVAGAKSAIASIIPSADALGAALGSGSTASSVQKADAISGTTLSAISQVVKPTNSAAGAVVGALQSTVALGSTIETAAKVSGGFSQALGAAAPWLGLIGSAVGLFSMFGSHKVTPSTMAKPQIEAALRSFKNTKSNYTDQEGLRNLLGTTTMSAAGMRAEGASGAPPVVVNIHPGAITANGVQDAHAFSTQIMSHLTNQISWQQQSTGLRKVS